MSAMSEGEAITAEGLEALKAELAHLEGDARREMAAAHPGGARARRPQGERRVPHRQGGPGAPGDQDQAPGRAPAQRGRRRRADRQRRGGLRHHGDVADERDRPRGDVHARGPDRGRPRGRQAVGRVAGGQGADGPPRRRRDRGPDAAAACAASASCASAADAGATRPLGVALSVEEVLVERADQRRGARAVLLADVAREAADDHRRLARGLVAHEVGRRRGLVGDGDRRRAQLEAARVAAPAPVVERREAGDADGHVALPVAPGAAEGVGDDHGGPVGQRGAQARGRSRRGRAAGGRARRPRRRVGGVDAGVGAHEAVVGAADEHAALRAQHARRTRRG